MMRLSHRWQYKYIYIYYWLHTVSCIIRIMILLSLLEWLLYSTKIYYYFWPPRLTCTRARSPSTLATCPCNGCAYSPRSLSRPWPSPSPQIRCYSRRWRDATRWPRGCWGCDLPKQLWERRTLPCQHQPLLVRIYIEFFLLIIFFYFNFNSWIL